VKVTVGHREYLADYTLFVMMSGRRARADAGVAQAGGAAAHKLGDSFAVISGLNSVNVNLSLPI
jgi:hypothetical protein